MITSISRHDYLTGIGTYHNINNKVPINLMIMLDEDGTVRLRNIIEIIYPYLCNIRSSSNIIEFLEREKYSNKQMLPSDIGRLEEYIYERTGILLSFSIARTTSTSVVISGDNSKNNSPSNKLNKKVLLCQKV